MSQNRKYQFKGKQILLLGLVALVITAGYYRWTVESDQFSSVPVTGDTLPANAEQGENGETKAEEGEAKPQEGTEGQSGGIAKLKQERDSARSEMAAQWRETMQNKEASAEAKTDAEKKLKAADEYTEKEKAIETLVKTKGFSDCFARVDESGVSVVVSGGEVNGAKVAQVKDIVVEQTGAAVKNIKVSAE